MNEDLYNEVEAINSIYGDASLVATSEQYVFVLQLPQHDTSLRVSFPPDYPSSPPSVLGTESSGGHSRKGDAAHIVDVFRDALGRLYQPGEVCLFDVIEEVNSSTSAPDVIRVLEPGDSHENENSIGGNTPRIEDNSPLEQHVPWTLSDIVVEMKSVFVARAAPVSSPDQAKQYLQHLLDNDKKVRSATHNITAWRIKGANGVSYQDCDDDGETAAGGRVLHLMQLMDVWNVMVVITRCASFGQSQTLASYHQ
ncbi:eIF2 kinase Gcn2p negative regulator [Cadophora gregata]|uniref:eIF2 kinase Gcn2p negative regulator n=1 Tax=Cadophora gregata TaxID=51156 RepID=UPI0026DD35D8|nr:eIF2 kinase Gcn2p negative regulator [Cadophora gregata]KAK0123779.1 eIF2 kinase Gcn2p negative regulator [Cadophora gregata]KAK0130123.1 eIF2 kinase Gcn2p negative regulator [Cadophora gregata f. sp. sojae]